MKKVQRVLANIFHLNHDSHIHIVEIVNGMLITEVHSRLGGRKQIWKEVRQDQ